MKAITSSKNTLFQIQGENLINLYLVYLIICFIRLLEYISIFFIVYQNYITNILVAVHTSKCLVPVTAVHQANADIAQKHKLLTQINHSVISSQMLCLRNEDHTGV